MAPPGPPRPIVSEKPGVSRHEGDQTAGTRGVVVSLDFPQRFDGRLRLHALDNDKNELGRADLAENFNQAAASQRNVTFPFPADMRLSKVSLYVLHGTPPKTVTLD